MCIGATIASLAQTMDIGAGVGDLPIYGGTGTFTPAPSLLWLDGDKQVFKDAGITPATNGSVIAQWNDLSGANNTATQATGGDQWTYTTGLLNGHSGMCNSTNTGAFMALPNDVVKGQFTAYVVWKQSSLVGFESPFGSSVIDSLVLATDNSSPAFMTLGQSGVSVFPTNLTMAAGGWHITSYRSGGIEAAGNAAGRTVATIRQDGTTGTGATEGNSLANLTNGNVTELFVDRGLSGTALNGCMVSMLVDGKVDSYSTMLSTEKYLANRYGLTLNAQPTYSLTPAGLSSWWGPPQKAIARGAGGSFDSNDVEGASCIYESSTYYCYYTGWNAGYTNAGIGLATGPSLSNLTKQGEVLSAGVAAWETAWVSCPTIKHIGSIYVLFYCGSPTTGFEAGSPQVGFAYASSPSGPFTRSTNNPVITLGTSGAWDANAEFAGNSIIDNGSGTTFVYYNAKSTSTTPESMGCATTSSPITAASTFTKCAGNPIFSGGANGTWNYQRVFNFRIIPNGSGGYIGFYSGNYNDSTANCGQTGIKTNTGDLVTWTDYANNPIAVTGGGSGAGCIGRLGPIQVNGQWQALVDDIQDTYMVVLDIN